MDNDGVSEWVCELNGNSHAETQLYCLTMNGSFPAPSPWPEYYHCAYPAEYQAEQDWLLLKASYSNSLHFPMELNVPENVVFVLLVAIPISLVKRRPGC